MKEIKQKMALAVGLMSGTTLHGLDVALVEIQGIGTNTSIVLKDFLTFEIPQYLKNKITQCLISKSSSVALICSLNFELGYFFAQGVQAICKQNAIQTSILQYVASPGQTVCHMPNGLKGYVPSTLQLGETSVLAQQLKTTIVSDFSYKDLRTCGQGAPLIPFADYLLYTSAIHTRILQNIGGIASATILPVNTQPQNIVAFDTGPGTLIIDEMCRRFYNIPYDENGHLASHGGIHQRALDYMLNHPYFKKSIPKTATFEAFGPEYVEMLLSQFTLNQRDWITTATEFTAISIAKSVLPFIVPNTQLILSGGGAHNHYLINRIRYHLPRVSILVQEDLGYSSDSKEAIAMAVLGNQTLQHMPGNLQSVTMAAQPIILGKITYY